MIIVSSASTGHILVASPNSAATPGSVSGVAAS